MKRYLFLITVLVATSAMAYHSEWVNGIEWRYEVKDGEATIGDDGWRNYLYNTTGDITIPSSLGGYPVTKIGPSVFSGSGITSVVMPDSIRIIDECVFSGCSALTNVTFSACITSIGSSAFSFCDSLQTIVIPETVQDIGHSAFSSCKGLQSAKVLARVSQISDSLFSGCAELALVELPDTVTCIGYGAFGMCEKLASIRLPSGLKHIQLNAFNDCGLSSVELPDGLEVLEDYAFNYCTNLSSIIIPASVEDIGYGVFGCCNKLTAISVDESNPYYCSMDGVLFNEDGTELVEYPSGKGGAYSISANVTTVGGAAFVSCVGLTEVRIPASVTNVEDACFGTCEDLKAIVVAPANPSYSSVDGVLFNKDQTILIACPGGKTGDYEIPTTVTRIGEWAFASCGRLTSITIPTNVAMIGEGAFDFCRGLTSLTLPPGLKRIERCTFRGCIGLTTVEIPNGVTTIEDRAFESCGGLSTVTIPPSVTDIGYGSFLQCRNLTSIKIPSSVVHIGNFAFGICDSLIRIYVDEGDGDVIKRLLNESQSLNLNNVGFIEARGNQVVSFISTNVVIHYVVNSVLPEKIIPASADTGFVNVITEVKSGGVVSIPATWMVNYPSFVSKFGSDFTKALMMPTGKRDGAGNAMLVWQDYVAGTDPTKEDDVFKASITKDTNGKVIISYTPEFKDENEKKKRKYTTLGKKSLMDATDWEVVPEGHEADYNFFKVTVEMQSIQSK